MMKEICMVLLAALVVMLISCNQALAGEGHAHHPSQGKETKTETLRPSGIHEDCVELTAGQGIDYSFDASKPVDFNIHYHDDSKIFYSVEKDSVNSDKGTVKIEKKQHYCLMWTNPGSGPAHITYSYTITK